MSTNQLQELPAVNDILQEIPAELNLPKRLILKLVQERLTVYRKLARAGKLKLQRSEIREEIVQYLISRNTPFLRNVINGTGVTLHTGLGRAPFSREMLQAALERLEGYVNLEFDLEDGERGERSDHIEPLLRALTGAQAGLAVNNNAAAVFLSLNTLATDREVVISRGQLVEIGGSFRIPDVIAKSGCLMKEVGTTNRTHLKDYERAITKATALLLWAHTSNYRVEGFTAEVDLKELVELGRQHNLPVMADLGSGALVDLKHFGLPTEMTVASVLNTGVDLVTFSGDKLLGGPQSGLIVGREVIISKIHANPIYRAVRLDKTILSLLEFTLRSYKGNKIDPTNLTWHLLALQPQELEKRARAIISELNDTAIVKLGVAGVSSTVEAGSGSLPVDQIPSFALRFNPVGISVGELARQLRSAGQPIVGYIRDNSYFIDLRTVLPAQDETLVAILREI